MRVYLLLLTLPLAACLDWPAELLNPDGAGPKPDVEQKDGKVTPGDKKVTPKDTKVPPPKDQKVPPPKDQKVPPPKDQKVPPPKDQKVPPPKDQFVPPPPDQFVPPPNDQFVPPPTLKNNGTPCGGAGECYSNQCFDGVCCDRACAGDCFTCKAPGKVGKCEPVGWGDKPPAGKGCPTSSGASCGTDGTCDGAGKCKKWSGNVCKQGSCYDEIKINLAWICDGNNNCINLKNQASEIDCKEYKCKSPQAGCYPSCQNKHQCKSGKKCSSGKCDGKSKPLGAPCSSAGQCESGKCADGVCCENTCTDACMTCAQEGAKGRCVRVTLGNKPPSGKSCPFSPPCGADGRCGSNGKCRNAAAAGTACGTTTCAGGALNTFACTGFGGCHKSSSPCGAYACQPGGKGCYGRCTSASHCAPGKTCAAQQCK